MPRAPAAHGVAVLSRPADPVEYVAAYLLKNNTVRPPCVCLLPAVRFYGDAWTGLLTVRDACVLQNNPDSAAPATS